MISLWKRSPAWICSARRSIIFCPAANVLRLFSARRAAFSSHRSTADSVNVCPDVKISTVTGTGGCSLVVSMNDLPISSALSAEDAEVHSL